MTATIVYVYPVVLADRYEPYALRFLESYHNYPPGFQHDTIVVLNGGRADTTLRCLFGFLPRCRLIEHDNSGYDIGAFQHACRECDTGMVVFFGASTYFTRRGWLMRMEQSFEKHGNAQYGAMGNRGNLSVKVWPHIRTTAFWMSPHLFNSFPKRIVRPEDRHPFEHGPDCFTGWVSRNGLENWVVTWSRELLWKDWDSDPNGYQRGNQGSLLAGDHLCEPPYYPR